MGMHACSLGKRARLHVTPAAADAAAPVVKVCGAYQRQQQLDLLPCNAVLERAPDGAQCLVHNLLWALGHVLPGPVDV